MLFSFLCAFIVTHKDKEIKWLYPKKLIINFQKIT
nr:MAG TPA: hypothetical protein [Caudoviricetes sp.]